MTKTTELQSRVKLVFTIVDCPFVLSRKIGVTDWTVCTQLFYRQVTTYTTVLMLFWNMSGTTHVSRYQKGKPGRLKPIWIYWSKR